MGSETPEPYKGAHNPEPEKDNAGSTDQAIDHGDTYQKVL